MDFKFIVIILLFSFMLIEGIRNFYDSVEILVAFLIGWIGLFSFVLFKKWKCCQGNKD